MIRSYTMTDRKNGLEQGIVVSPRFGVNLVGPAGGCIALSRARAARALRVWRVARTARPERYTLTRTQARTRP